MHVVYTCYGGAHSSPVAAALHLGLLPRDRPPSAAQLLAVPLFDRTERQDFGKLQHVGVDGAGNRVYVLGRGTRGRSVLRALACGAYLAGLDPLDLVFVDTLVTVNLWMRIGGFLSRRLGWVPLGRPLVIFGTRRAFRAIVRLVEQAEAVCRARSSVP